MFKMKAKKRGSQKRFIKTALQKSRSQNNLGNKIYTPSSRGVPHFNNFCKVKFGTIYDMDFN
jgi:hypothetical protein